MREASPEPRASIASLGAALAVVAVVVLGLASSAAAELTGSFKAFEQCPYANTEVSRCLNVLTEQGEFVLGKTEVPIVNPVTLQAGVTKASGEFSKLIAARNGDTLSRTPQPVPGGLLGIAAPKNAGSMISAVTALLFANPVTGVSATLELALPANRVLLSELHLGEGEETAMKLPVKIHLENALLGASCYVGSARSPILLELTSGSTNPPPPNKTMTGSSGFIEFIESGRILETKGAKLVDNAWVAPSASGCGGPLSFLVDPIIDEAIGLPSPAGYNTALLQGKISIATAVTLGKVAGE